MQELSVRVSWLCHADATFFYFCEKWNILLKLPAISWLLKWSFVVWHKLLRLRQFSMCLSRVECSLENGLCQSTNPFSFDVHAGVFVLLLNLCNGVNLTSSSGLYSFEPLSRWYRSGIVETDGDA